MLVLGTGKTGFRARPASCLPRLAACGTSLFLVSLNRPSPPLAVFVSWPAHRPEPETSGDTTHTHTQEQSLQLVESLPSVSQTWEEGSLRASCGFSLSPSFLIYKWGDGHTYLLGLDW